MIVGFQLIVVIFALFMFYVTYLHNKKRELSFFETFFFDSVWLGTIVLTLIPQTARFILNTFHIMRLLDLGTIFGFMLLITIGFRNYIELKKMKKKLDEITRHIAITSVKKRN